MSRTCLNNVGFVNNAQYFYIAGITIQLDSDLPIDENTFHPKFNIFRVEGRGDDNVSIHHHFSLPDLTGEELGRQLYCKPPWAIYRQNGHYIYHGISSRQGDSTLHRIVKTNDDHSCLIIYNDNVREDMWRSGNLHSITMFPSDQILLARLMANRWGCFLHSSGVIINGAGVLFIGHSGAGKSTAMDLVINSGDNIAISVKHLCEDRNIVRRLNDDWYVFGTWNHYQNPRVSSASAPLRMICFLEQANENKLTRINDRKAITKHMLECIVKPFVTPDWWEKIFEILDLLSQEVPCYFMQFDKSGEIAVEIAKVTELQGKSEPIM